MSIDCCLSHARRRIAYIALVLPIVLQLSAARAQEQADAAWTLIVVPDIKIYVEKERNMGHFITQMRWIADNIETYRVAFVTQLGDLVQSGSRTSEWARAEQGLGLIHGLVPYSISIGDHDYRKEDDRRSGAKEFVRRFGAARYQGQPWYGGASPDEKSHFQIFTAGGRRFLHLNLEWEVPGSVRDPDSAMGWAREILDTYRHLPTIISTHSHITDREGRKGRTRSVEERAGDGNTGETVWKSLIADSPQVFMVLNGHFHAGTRQYDPTDPAADPAAPSDDGELHQVSTNAAGLPVYEMLSNYQDYPNGGDGWIRIIRFLPGGGAIGMDRISVQTYSTTHDAYQTDALSQFHFDLSFAQRFDGMGAQAAEPSSE